MIVVTAGGRAARRREQGRADVQSPHARGRRGARAAVVLLSACRRSSRRAARSSAAPATGARRINGVDPDYQQIRDWPMHDGVFFDDDDVRANRRVVVLGKTVATEPVPERRPGRPAGAGARRALHDHRRARRQGADRGRPDQDDVVLVPYTTVAEPAVRLVARLADPREHVLAGRHPRGAAGDRRHPARVARARRNDRRRLHRHATRRDLAAGRVRHHARS